MEECDNSSLIESFDFEDLIDESEGVCKVSGIGDDSIDLINTSLDELLEEFGALVEEDAKRVEERIDAAECEVGDQIVEDVLPAESLEQLASAVPAEVFDQLLEELSLQTPDEGTGLEDSSLYKELGEFMDDYVPENVSCENVADSQVERNVEEMEMCTTSSEGTSTNTEEIDLYGNSDEGETVVLRMDDEMMQALDDLEDISRESYTSVSECGKDYGNPGLCHQCGEEFVDDELYVHLINEHQEYVEKVVDDQETDSEDVEYPCNFCDRSFSSLCNIERHIQVKHSKAKKRCCKKCGFICVGAARFEAHSKWHKVNDYFVCYSCGNVFSDRYLIVRHLNSHVPGRFSCNICNKIFTQINHLRAHEQTHLKPKYSCDKCPTFFTRKDGLNAHMKRMHKINEVECKSCNEIFENRFSLTQHRRDNLCKKFVCRYCSFRSADRQETSTHTRTHTFCCKVCFSSYKTKRGLDAHTKSEHFYENNFSDDSESDQLVFASILNKRNH